MEQIGSKWNETQHLAQPLNLIEIGRKIYKRKSQVVESKLSYQDVAKLRNMQKNNQKDKLLFFSGSQVSRERNFGPDALFRYELLE